MSLVDKSTVIEFASLDLCDKSGLKDKFCLAVCFDKPVSTEVTFSLESFSSFQLSAVKPLKKQTMESMTMWFLVEADLSAVIVNPQLRVHKDWDAA